MIQIKNLFSNPIVVCIFYCLSTHFFPFFSSIQENSGFLLNALLKRGLSEEQPVPDAMPISTAAPDAFNEDAVTPEPEDLDTVAPNSAAPSPPQPLFLAQESQHSPSSAGPGDPLEEELRSKLSQLVSHANSKDSSSSGDECKKRPVGQPTDKENDILRERTRPKDTDRGRQRPSDRLRDRTSSKESEGASETVEHMNGKETKRSERLIKSASMREEGRVRERRSGSLERTASNKEQKRGDKKEQNRQMKRQNKRDAEKEAEQRRGARRSGSSASSPANTPSSQEGVLSDNQVRR